MYTKLIIISNRMLNNIVNDKINIKSLGSEKAGCVILKNIGSIFKIQIHFISRFKFSKFLAILNIMINFLNEYP